MCDEQEWRKSYPFADKWMKTPEGFRLHYVDEGAGFPVVMLHGNPTWSFMYRRMIAALARDGRRAIALDHLGCGLSDKPQRWGYRLADHIDNFRHFVENELRLRHFDLVVHDWGGAIGMGYAALHPDRIRNIVLMNTAAFTSKFCPARIAFIRNPVLGPFLVRGLNLFARSAIHMAVAHPMSPAAAAGMLYPYSNWHDRVAIYRFVRDIPMKPSHPSWQTLKTTEQHLGDLASKKILLCWGAEDFCFNMNFFEYWRHIYPHALDLSFKGAGHYLLEDMPQEIIPLVSNFLR